MNLSQARQEFQIRRYLWAKRKAAEEIKDELPHFWLFKGGASWKYYQFMKSLENNELKLYVNADLRRSHRHAAANLGESNSPEENAIEEQFFRFQEFSPFERELASRKRKGEIVKFVSKGRVQTAMIASFKKAFGGPGLEVTRMNRHRSPLLHMRFLGWLVYTNFNFSGGRFGGGRSVIQYSHLIVSEERICHPTTPGVTGPALLLANALCWIGLGRMEWDYLMEADIEPACDSVVTLCREFFDELPKLLKGLERENVTSKSSVADNS
jgi:hypothetical protein